MFELTKSCRLGTYLVDLILQSLSVLSKNNEKYFWSLDVSSSDWVKDSFVLSAFKSAKLTVPEDNITTKKAIQELLPFSTSYLCEAGFSAMNTIKSKNRSKPQTLEEDLRV
jgi:hypothetical protein